MRLGVTAGGTGRLAFPLGIANYGDIVVIGNTVIIGDQLRYAELFNPGYGATVQLDVMLRGEDRGSSPFPQSSAA